ncbi:hypothetical protein [Aureimonas ureilytica]|nr:hypothetical protein [Aureimonas ureilytica]
MAERPVSMPSGITLSSQSGAIVLKRKSPETQKVLKRKKAGRRRPTF